MLLRLFALGILAAGHIALVVAVFRSTRQQPWPTLLIIVACLVSLANSGIPFGSRAVHWMSWTARDLGRAGLDASRWSVGELGQSSLIDAAVWSFLLLALVL